METVLTVAVGACSTHQVENVVLAETSAMIDTDALMKEFEEEQRHLESLIQRSIEQSRDIREMQKELDKLKETIRSEQVEV